MPIILFFISLWFANYTHSTLSEKKPFKENNRWILHKICPNNISLVSFWQQYCYLLQATYRENSLCISGSQSVLPGFQENSCALHIKKHDFEHALKSAISTPMALKQAQTIYASWSATTV